MSLLAPHSLDSLLPVHQAAVADFLEAAAAIPEAQWESPLAPGRWSPAQVTEHLRLTYEFLLRELQGQRGLRPRLPVWLRPIVRVRYLGAILRQGVFPEGARAPSELRPGPGPFPHSNLLRNLGLTAEHCETEFRRRWTRRLRLTHHVFGRLSAPQALRLLTAHTRHHRAQLATPSPSAIGNS